MQLLIDGHTSQDFWRSVYPPARKLERSATNLSSDECAVSAADAWAMAPKWLTPEYLQQGPEKLGVLALGGDKIRRQSKTHIARSWQGKFPDGSFYPCGNGAFVSSPCFTFLQMAQELEFAQLVAYGDELCGTYAFDPKASRGMRRREHPLITKAQLAAFLAGASECRGHRRAMQALPHIIERSPLRWRPRTRC